MDLPLRIDQRGASGSLLVTELVAQHRNRAMYQRPLLVATGE